MVPNLKSKKGRKVKKQNKTKKEDPPLHPHSSLPSKQTTVVVFLAVYVELFCAHVRVLMVRVFILC